MTKSTTKKYKKNHKNQEDKKEKNKTSYSQLKFKIRHKDFRPSVRNAQGTPLDSERGWTGNL